MTSTNVTDAGLTYLVPRKSLRTLGAWGGVRLTGEGLKHFANHPTLTDLVIGSSMLIDDEMMDDVAVIPKMVHLDLGDAPRVTDEGLKRLRSHAPLHRLNIAGTKVTGKGLRQTKDLLAELNHLAILTSSVPDGLGFLRDCPLQSLILNVDSRSDIVDRNLASLKVFPDLKVLWLVDATLTESQANQVSDLSGLTSLHLWRGRLESGRLEHLARLLNLEALYIDQEATISDAELRQLAALKKLKTLALPRAELEARSVIWLQSALGDCKITVSPAVQAAIDATRR